MVFLLKSDFFFYFLKMNHFYKIGSYLIKNPKEKKILTLLHDSPRHLGENCSKNLLSIDLIIILGGLKIWTKSPYFKYK